MPRIIAILLFVFPALVLSTTAQHRGVWEQIDPADRVLAGLQSDIRATKFTTYRLDQGVMRALLAAAPGESERNATGAGVEIGIPISDGRLARFSVFDSPVMEPELAAKFPEIRTYAGQGIDDPAATVRLDFTPFGFHAMIRSPAGTVYVDPYSRSDSEHYIVYTQRDLGRDDGEFRCLVGSQGDFSVKSLFPTVDKEIKAFDSGENDVVFNSGTLRTYRTAVAATGEYTAFWGGTVAQGMAGITTTMNRVNGIYQSELSVRMILVANNNSIVYTNATTDPYTNNNGFTMLGQNQANLTAVIGPANYDIGHVFSTGGGGVAALQSPCDAASKAQGVTGSPSPTGDAFDVDYVAHEMGHQYGGNHTFNNNNEGSCSGNRSASAAYEPGSASTIQGYAGICGNQDLQRNSDAYFHVKSLEEMVAFISNNSTGGSCDVESANGNTAPTVPAVGACTVPIQTPFVLTGTATDPNGDTLTATWEEYDLGTAGNTVPNADAGNRPIFRSYRPLVSGFTRYFPSLPFILNNANTPPSTFSGINPVGTSCSFGNCMTGELLPSTTRIMNFQMTVRDNQLNGAIRSIQTNVAVSNTAGPFQVTAPNTAVSWAGGSVQNVTWNVASTTNATINCQNVNILLSTNGGTSFTTTLAANTPNDGAESVLIPNSPTANARVQVRCSTSCFFDIGNANFTITPPTAANTSISGRVVTSSGSGIRGVILTLLDSSGQVAGRAVSNGFGYFTIPEIPAGATYTLQIASKTATFSPRIISVSDSIEGLEIVAGQ